MFETYVIRKSTALRMLSPLLMSPKIGSKSSFAYFCYCSLRGSDLYSRGMVGVILFHTNIFTITSF